MLKTRIENERYIDTFNVSDTLNLVTQDSGAMLVHEEEGSETPLKGLTGGILGALTLSDGKYIAVIDESHVLSLYSRKGRLKKNLDPAGDGLLCLVKFSENLLGLAYKNYGLTIWDLKSLRKVGEIDGKLLSADDLIVSDYSGELFPYGWFIFYEANKASICSKNGEVLFRISGLSDKAIRGIYLYPEHCVIIHGTNEVTRSIWDKSGACLAKHGPSKHGRAAQMEIDGCGIVVVEDDGRIFHHQTDGRKEVKAHTTDGSFLDTARDISEIGWNIVKKVTENPTPEHFPHSTNPISEPKPIVSERRRIKRLSKTNKGFEKLWTFFNRPNIDAIRTALGAEMRKLRGTTTALAEKESALEVDLRKAKGRAPLLYLSIAIALIASVSAFYLFPGEDGTIGAIFALLAVLVLSHNLRKLKKKIHNIKQIVHLVQVLEGKSQSLIKEIRAYRRDIIAGLPVINDPDVYSGSEVCALIESKVKENLKSLAMNESGVIDKDIVYKNNEPIILRDWASIQEIPEQVRTKINAHNLNSFWVAEDGQIVFAVQFVQFIFLAEDKLDVFTCFYDFVQDFSVWKETHAFYYKDVTNISKKDVSRADLTLLLSSRDNNEQLFPATEISFSVSSGEKICLTILKSDSFSIDDDEEMNLLEDEGEDQVKALELERDRILSEDSLSAEDKAEIRSEFSAFIEQAKMDAANPDYSLIESKADDAIANIRMHVRASKERIRDGAES